VANSNANWCAKRNGSEKTRLKYFLNDADLCNVVRFSNCILLVDDLLYREINSPRDILLTQLDIISVRCLMDG